MAWGKYHNRKVVIDGITFDSQREGDYYCELKMLRMAGEVIDFERQGRLSFSRSLSTPARQRERLNTSLILLYIIRTAAPLLLMSRAIRPTYIVSSGRCCYTDIRT